MDDEQERLKPLLQELGDAINSGLSESESIGRTIEKIKEAGYDIFLIIEATIGFHKREGAANPSQEKREPKPLVEQDGSIARGTFTTKDNNFFRALKIKMDDN